MGGTGDLLPSVLIHSAVTEPEVRSTLHCGHRHASIHQLWGSTAPISCVAGRMAYDGGFRAFGQASAGW
jgi:hypothetical protein